MAVSPEFQRAYTVLDRSFHERDHIQPLLASLDLSERRINIQRVTDLCFGVARWALYLDGVAGKLSSKPMVSLEKEVRLILRLALYQLILSPHRPEYAVVDEATEYAKAIGKTNAARFINAVLREYLRCPEIKNEVGLYGEVSEKLSVRYSHPEFLVRRWMDRHGHRRTEEMLRANQEIPRMDLLARLRSISRDDLAERLLEAHITTEPSELSPAGLTVLRGNALGLPAPLRNMFYVEDLSCQAMAWLFSRLGGKRLLDAAAAPGGKSLALSQFQAYEVHVASDLFITRMARLRENLLFFGGGILPVLQDARNPGMRPGAFDRILLDAPCSGTGALRKNPEARWRLEEGIFREYHEKQVEILKALLPLLAPGGYLLYMTCSLEPEENEEVVERVTADHPEMSFVRRDARFPKELLLFQEQSGFFRILPSTRTDGMTAAVLKKAEG